MFDITQQIESHYREMVNLRRHFHMNPELSFQEYKTSQYIADYLTDLGLDEVRTNVGGLGVVGKIIIDTNLPTVALRADFDALPIQDEKDVSYKSTIDGVMHACGHDAHTASLLIVAKILNEHKNELTGNVTFIFQHGEEVDPGGAISMIKDGALDRVDIVFGQHMSSDLPVGTIGYKSGTLTGMPDDFFITMKGKGGHASKPESTIDPVAATISLCNQMQFIHRNIPSSSSNVLSITMIQTGSQNNIIPEESKVAGTIRTFDYQTQKIMIDSLKKCLNSTSTYFGVTYELEYLKGYPPIVNDHYATQLIYDSASNSTSIDKVIELEASLGGEDFSYYLQRVPGSFFHTGTYNPNFKAGYPHHHPLFDIDESGMKYGVEVLINATLKYFNDQS